jgi:phenylpyruvate tautomerase PptA (4-oxalocrotonate tautomerase family)
MDHLKSQSLIAFFMLLYNGWQAPMFRKSDRTELQETAMPLIRVSLRQGKPAVYRSAILEGIYRAMRATFDVPEEDRFMVINEHDETNFSFSPSYLGIKRSDDLVIIQLTVSNTRSAEKKRALYREIVAQLTKDPGLRPEDVFINLVEVMPEDWSFGHGIAQYAPER